MPFYLEIDSDAAKGLYTRMKPSVTVFDPDVQDVSALLQKGLRCQQAGQWQQAQDHYKAALRIQPDDPDALHLFGTLAHQVKKYDLAEQCIQGAIKNNPNKASYFISLGRLYRDASRLDEAIDSFHKAVSMQPKNPDFQVFLARAYILKGQCQEGEGYLTKLLKAYPDHADGWFALSSLYNNAERLDEALGAIDRALSLVSSSYRYHLQKAHILRRQNKFDAALKEMDKALELNNSDIEVPALQSHILFHLKRYEDAEAAAQRVLEANPNYLDMQVHMAAIYNITGRSELAIQACRALIPKTRFPERVYIELGKAYLTLNENEKALEAYNEIIKRVPHETTWYFFKWHCLKQLGREMEAKELMDYNMLVGAATIGEFLPQQRSNMYSDKEAYNKAMVEYVTQHESRQWAPDYHATRNGFHTNNTLLHNPDGVMQLHEQFIRESIDRFIHSDQIPEGHFLREHFPKRYKLNCWAVIMQEGGHQAAHIHPGGWISGCYYAQLPDKVKHGDNHQGWIEFGQVGYDTIRCDYADDTALFQPEEGRLFLFPSYMFHRTIPFSDSKERISIAFDVVEERDN